VTYPADCESSDDIAVARRLTSRDVAAAWGLALFGLVGLAAFSAGSFACTASRAERAAAPPAAEQHFCWPTATDIPRPR
jgi:hypothetical protein